MHISSNGTLVMLFVLEETELEEKVEKKERKNLE